jgi:hypothetical protein
MPKLQKTTKQIIQAAARAESVDLPTIAAALALMEGKPLPSELKRPLLVNQAEAARLFGVSRFMIRKLVADGRLTPINLSIDCVRYSLVQLETLALAR